MGDCVHCGRRAGFLRKKHRACDIAHRDGWLQMVHQAREAAGTETFSEAALHDRLAAIAGRTFHGRDSIHAAIVHGWREGVKAGLADGILTREEENTLRDFRDRLALDESAHAAIVRQETQRLDAAVRDRLMLTARMTAIAVDEPETALNALSDSLNSAGLSAAERQELLITAWEAAVEAALEDGVLSLDQEAALVRYLDRFALTVRDVDRSRAHRRLVEAGAIREAAEGIIPQRFQTDTPLPMNFMKSETLVWAFDNVEYSEVRVRRERRGSSHGVSIRIARGLYYSPRTFRSQSHEYDETVHVDTGLVALTNKHVYFRGGRTAFRIRYDKIVSFDMEPDGFGVIRAVQNARPQIFRTGDGWFAYNLVTNLARL